MVIISSRSVQSYAIHASFHSRAYPNVVAKLLAMSKYVEASIHLELGKGAKELDANVESDNASVEWLI